MLIKYGNIVLTTTTDHRVRYHLCLLLLVRVGGYIVNCQTFILTGSYRWPLFCSFRSSDCGNTTWHVPLPPRGVFCSAKSESRKHPRQGWSFTYQLKYWWDTYHFKNTYSPITLANFSTINFVSIVRCSSSTSNPVYARRVDSSASVFSPSSHRHS